MIKVIIVKLNGYIYFLFEDDELLEKYNEIWEKFSTSLKIGFDSEPV